MCPKLLIEVRRKRVRVESVLKPPKNLIIHLHLLPLLPVVIAVIGFGHSTTATLVVFHHRLELELE